MAAYAGATISWRLAETTEMCLGRADSVGPVPKQTNTILLAMKFFGCQAVVGCASGDFWHHLVYGALVDWLAQLCSCSPAAHGEVRGV